MSGARNPHAFIQTFLTHQMEDATVCALSTGRARETEEILDAVRRNLAATPGLLQHVVIYGPRGFGKSFMTRVIQLETASLSTPDQRVVFVLLPEEQRNIIRNPHVLLEEIASRLAGQRQGGDKTWTDEFFRWPRPDEAAASWDAASARLEAELDATLGKRGLAIVAVENFDVLLAAEFKEEADEQRLRKFLGRDGNRLMLLASGTRTADLDYERPLFQAFQSVWLEPWTGGECIAYFNRRRGLEDRAPLDEQTEAKARAIADFIGGNPRLAQLLGEVLDTEDALTVVTTMNALADKLADYYRRRIDDLPPLARGLVDALIRGGEPCSATGLAARVGATQSLIARVMGDLQHADIIRGVRPPDGREIQFRVIDRVFVHYYRLRQLGNPAGHSPLETILDLLRSFYSQDEKRSQAARYLTQGRPNEAMVFSRLAREGEPNRGTNRYHAGFFHRLRGCLSAAPDAIALSANEVMAILDGGQPSDLHAHCPAAQDAGPLTQAIHAGLRGQMQSRMGLFREAEATLRDSLDLLANAPLAAFMIADELSSFLWSNVRDPREAREIAARFIPDQTQTWPRPCRLRALIVKAVVLTGDRTTLNDSLDQSERAAILAAELEDQLGQAEAARHKAYALSELGRHGDAITAANEAAAFAAEAGDKREQAMAARHKAYALLQLGRHGDAITAANEAAAFAAEAGDKREQAGAARHKAYALSELGRHGDAITAANEAAAFAAEAGDKREQAVANRYKAYALLQLGRHGDAITAANEAAAFAAEAGDKREQAVAARIGAESLLAIRQADKAWPLAVDAFEVAMTARDFEQASRCVWTALRIARTVASPGCVPMFARLLDVQRLPGTPAPLVLEHLFADLVSAVMRADAWEAFDRLLGDHGAWVAAHHDSLNARVIGETLAAIGGDTGRAAAFAAADQTLRRLAALFRGGGNAARPSDSLTPIVIGFAEACRDSGLTRDIAGLIEDVMGAAWQPHASLLRDLAGYDDGTIVLARLDPDVAVLVRQLRGLPVQETPVRSRAKPRGKRRG